MKLGAAPTVKVIAVSCEIVPEIPVTVTFAAPSFAELLAVTVRVDVTIAALVTFATFELKLTVTPSGTPEAERLTLPVKPFAGLIVIVLASLLP